MNQSSFWQPVVPSHQVRTADNIVAGFFNAGELALWRGADGTVQAWENRCPHRGTRLTMGRIIDGKLSCAYHGWEFAANGGRCSTIPAQPSAPAPKNLCVTTYSAHESAGMIWVRPTNSEGDAPAPSLPESTAWFCRSLGITAPADRLEEELRALHWEQIASWTWSGKIASQRATLFISAASDELTIAHIWLAEKPQPQLLRLAMSALARLRERIEKPQGNRSAK
jgi:nitrite reductase/ring-hydroxylating ferredoxin subunit